MKRGAIEVQFNWIFILIIGAIILLFFFAIIKTQKGISEKKISATVRRDIKAILTGAGVSTGTASLVEVPKIKVDYDCEGYSIQETSPIKPVVSFSPDSIVDIKLMLWALDWNIGYRVTNFLYITSPNIRYILVFESGSIQQHTFVDIINETLPSKYIEEKKDKNILMNKEKAKLVSGQLKDLQDNLFINKNNYKVKFVFFNEDPSGLFINELEDMEDEDVTAINIIPDDPKCINNLDCFGTVTYYTKDNDKFQNYDGNSYYIKLPSLIGAVFSNLETYNCSMKDAFKRLQLVTEIYLNKTRVLKEYYSDSETYSATCLNIMTEIETVLQDINSYSDSFSETNVEDIYDEINTLEDLNDRAIKLSCTEIY